MVRWVRSWYWMRRWDGRRKESRSRSRGSGSLNRGTCSGRSSTLRLRTRSPYIEASETCRTITRHSIILRNLLRFSTLLSLPNLLVDPLEGSSNPSKLGMQDPIPKLYQRDPPNLDPPFPSPFPPLLIPLKPSSPNSCPQTIITTEDPKDRF